LAWPHLEDQAVSGLKLLWRERRENRPRLSTSLPTRARASGPPPSRGAGHPLYSAGRMLDLV